MYVVQALDDIRVFDRRGALAYEIGRGEQCAVYEIEARRGEEAGAFRLIAPLELFLPPFEGHAESIVLPFVGRLGDALVAASCLAGLRQQPSAPSRVTMAARSEIAELLDHVEDGPEVVRYPLRVSQISGFSHFCSFEDIERIPQAASRSLADVFSRQLRVPRPNEPVRLRVASVCDFGDVPTVGIQLVDPWSLRSIPMSRLMELCERLTSEKLHVVFLGRAGEVKAPTLKGNEFATDLIGHTESIGDLIAAVAGLNVLICPDSFLMHLAGCLNIPTVVVFASTNAVLASDYPSCVAMRSSMECSPCGKSRGICPLGYSRCEAQWDDALSVENLYYTVLAQLVGAPVATA